MNTSTMLIVIGLLVLLAVILIAWLSLQKRRSERLRERFGPEYQRTVEQYGDKRRAEEELAGREKRVQALDIHPLTLQERDHFQEEWRTVQAEFVDAPDKAVTEADLLVQQLMQARGYPVGDFEQRAADISVEHANVVTHYRTAHDIAQRDGQGKGTTEDLRQAMVHYRALFDELLETLEAKEQPKGKAMEVAR
jgi:FtsZ-interacting cell division protein ZipA